MADEKEIGVTSEVVTTDTPTKVPAPKKQRAPRRLKAAAEATASEPSATSVKTAKVPRKKRVTQVEAAPPLTSTGRIKRPRKAKSVTPAEVPKVTPVTAGDEMADLIQLEEENKRLRAALSEKLRAENADLRKRLGV